jgi:hypothetical protein
MDSSSSSEEEIQKNKRSNELKANQKSYRMREKLKVDEHSLYQSLLNFLRSDLFYNLYTCFFLFPIF